ncbi:hypothetical protein QZH41_011759 [Actinostola sp. cb2023]|nr:hypothetical protein QZH41_011759 [Actinostola sp. cb2023]
MYGIYYPMNNEGYIQLNRVMPVPLEDSDIESNLSNEETGSFSELSNPHTPPLGRGATNEVKQELQKAIRCRRVAQGLEEMPSFDAKRSGSNQLSAAELEKRRLRRERNKVAAFKCRQRRKEHMQVLEDETDELNVVKRSLESEIAALKDKKKELDDMLKTHACMLIMNSSDDDDNKSRS